MTSQKSLIKQMIIMIVNNLSYHNQRRTISRLVASRPRPDQVLKKFVAQREAILCVGPNEGVGFDPSPLVVFMEKSPNGFIALIDTDQSGSGPGWGNLENYYRSLFSFHHFLDFTQDSFVLFYGDAFQMPLRDSDFDIIVDHVSLRFIISRKIGRRSFPEYTTDSEDQLVRNLLGEYWRILKPKGTAIVFIDDLCQPFVDPILTSASDLHFFASIEELGSPTFQIKLAQKLRRFKPRYKPTYMIALEKLVNQNKEMGNPMIRWEQG